MVHSTAAGKPAGQKAPVLFQPLHIAFPPAVLVPANDYGIPVLPEEEDDFPFLHMMHEVFLHREISEGVLGLFPVT